MSGSDHHHGLAETLHALRLVLEQIAAANKPPEEDPRRHFYKMFNREADEYDKDFHKKYHDDLNTILIFAGLFATVASAFIVEIQQELQPGSTGTMPATSPGQSGPNASTVQVQSILFASLASALLASFLAMLGKQWLNFYVEGSLVDRSRHRELRMRGMIAWRFKTIMECVPVIMQISLLLLGCALAQYLWGISRTVSAVIIAFTVFGALSYLFIVFAATFWKMCPFQTPVSIFLRYVISLAKKRRYPRPAKVQDQLSALARFRELNQSFATPMTSVMSIGDEELASPSRIPSATSTPTAMMVNLEGEESTQASDTNCISTMFKFVGSSDAVVALTGFIPEINWTSGVQRVPLLEVFDCLCRSFEFLKDGRVLVRPGMRAQAFGSARALLHLRVQRLCVGAPDDAHIVASKIGSLFGHLPGEDHELESTLQVLDAVFNKERAIRWEEFVLGDAHYCWLSYTLRCRAWVSLRAKGRLTEEVLGFVRHSLSKEPLPPSRVIADCLLIVKMTIDFVPPLNDKMLIKDKSEEIQETLRQIYRNLQLAISPNTTDHGREIATGVLELVAHLKQENLCDESYKLFLAIMASGGLDDWLWRLAELSLIGAFKWDIPQPQVEDPTPIVQFLAHCFEKQEEGVMVDDPVERGMLALASAPAGAIGDGIARFDFTRPLFFNGICRALRDDAPYPLRRATVTFLRHLDTQLFNTNKTFGEDQVKALISGWSSSTQEVLQGEHDQLLEEALFATLMGLLDSLLWREHIPESRWSILKSFGGIAEEQIPPSFYRCVKNSTIIPNLKTRGALGRTILAQWATILWERYPDLSEEVQSQLENTTRKMIAGSSKHTLSSYLTIVDGEIQRIKDKINSHVSWSLGDDGERLRTKLDSLRSARKKLAGMKTPVP